MARIVLESVTFDHPDGTVVLRGIDLAIDDGEFLVVVGPSGSGKTTLLRILAGLDRPRTGRLLFDGVDGVDLSPQQRNVGMVFQDHALYSHFTAEGNLSFPLIVRSVEESEREQRVARTAEPLGLSRLLKRRPRELSDGHRNALATGRALVRDPDLLLMDEPLANLDAPARERARREIRLRHRERIRTTVYVTHDQVEALALGDRVAVINRGSLQQVAPPLDLFEHPANLFVARFIGSPPMSVLAADVRCEGPRCWLAVGEDQLALDHLWSGLLGGWHGRRILVGMRAADLALATMQPFEQCLHGVCRYVENLGRSYLIGVSLGDDRQLVVESATVAAPGNRVEIAVDLAQLHFFDPESGTAIPGQASG